MPPAQALTATAEERIVQPPASVGAYLKQRAALVAMLRRPGGAGMALARSHAALADQLLSGLVSANAGKGAHEAVLLGAVGGYGRGLLGLESDLDVCFVTTERPDDVGALVESILYPLWDSGISVGHQIIRPVDAVRDAQAELAVATELLDFRPLWGDEALLHSVKARLFDGIFSAQHAASFIERLEAQARKRHAQFGDSVYLLEPDVKNGTGGLRDLDFALWAARVRFGSGDPGRLAALGVLTPRGMADLQAALEFVWTVRNHLHHGARRKNDRLTFSAQEATARALGYACVDAGTSDLQRTGQMVEAFMSDYYRHARAIAQARDRILGHAKRRSGVVQAPVTRLGEDFVVCEGRLGLADPTRLLAEPTLALRLYATAVASDMSLLSRTRDAIVAVSGDPAFGHGLRDCAEAATLFVSLVCSVRSVAFASGSILGELHDVGLLLAMIPEFAPVVGRVHNDLYHVYTVDVHSIAAVDRLRALTRGDLASTLPLASRLAGETTRRTVLFLATLLHDVGKGIGARDHSRLGADLARGILRRLGVPPDEVDDACHLILHHLTMYVVAVRRDLGDPATVAEFVRDVRGREGLRELFLLTVADLSTTSSVALTKWKRSMLDGLFRAADVHLAGETCAVLDRASRVRAAARSLWTDATTGDAFDEYLASMPVRYFLAHTAQEVSAHGALAIEPRDAPIGLSVVPSTHPGVMGLCVVTEGNTGAGLCVVAGDRPGLLASISAAISANRFTIQAAQIHSRKLARGDYQAVDVFWVQGAMDEASMPEYLDRLRRDLTAMLNGELAPGSMVKPRSHPTWCARSTPPVPTEILFDHHGSSHDTIIEVLTEDQPALLYKLATALHELGLSISVAKISTEGTRAIDVFYATEADGSKVAPGKRTAEIRAALVSAVTGS